MKRLLFLAALVLLPLCALAQPYTADWASLDTRPTPSWWTEARFGIFIHWGVYAVPAFSKVGEYSEWYWNALTNGKPDYVAFHERVFGKNFAYQDFAPLFKAELFDPAQWADVFRRSGAKYIVLTSKHHDGFALWPSAEANTSWGRPWNSVDAGPGRDLLGDLTDAVRQAGLEMGLYFSLYEWYNPLYRADPTLYVEKHYLPQFKDVVTRYKPAVIFADGEWDHEDKLWKSEEVVAWLYNESPVKDRVIVNDRWGKGARHQHGGYYTTEYGSGMPDASHPWEENRGMAYSYGYSRTESRDDYNTAQQLILMLVDIVSRGGNFLLDIGPTADGRIPVIMQERLLQMGTWLDVNGEAIYGTRTWKTPTQWSDGEVVDAERGEYMVRYDILALTVSPPPGRAVKQVFFTRKNDTLYAITPRWPKGGLVLKDVQPTSRTVVHLLGRAEPLTWRREGNSLVIDVPALSPDEVPSQHAHTFRITHVAE